MEKKKTSWKTTVGAIAMFIGLVCAGITGLLDDNPLTNPDYAGIIELMQSFGWISAGVGGAITGFFARDKNVTSEDENAK